MARQLPIQDTLDSGEHLLWEGQPKQGVVFRYYDFFLIPFSIVWLSFAVFWEIMAVETLLSLRGQDPHLVAFVFPAIGLVFVLIGVQFVFGRHYSEAKRRRKTFYGVTNDRALIVSGARPKSIRSHAITPYTELELSVRRSEFGTISFGKRSIPKWLMPYHMFGLMQDDTEFSFIEIRDAKRVYDIVRSIQKQQA